MKDGFDCNLTLKPIYKTSLYLFKCSQGKLYLNFVFNIIDLYSGKEAYS